MIDVVIKEEKQETVFDRLPGEVPPVARLVGWTLLQLDKQAQVIHLSFDSPAEFVNPGGTVHGGFLTAMLDECMGSAVVGLHEARFLPSTVSMNIDFIKPVMVGKIYGQGIVTSMGRTSAFLEARLCSAEGLTLARATGVYRLLPWPEALRPRPA
ncbi:PaaI family thioesterase [Streptomyces sp. 891-h]|uniref:PaaI family thioesterase n=1 Tax=unclassified Streptomyces TaxID=2593676 RepID=UPI001FA957D3|nr:PaaI family thioesterase [Streptomyces sp. 891-h]UNZ15748.1 PaaI family thioesterase [Streptomyces sp. 891-h]